MEERNFKIKTGSDFSGVGAFDQALIKLGIKQDKIFACDWDKYARKSYVLNYGEPKYYPKDVYEREIPKEPLDIYMTSPPCQSFSLAGKRKGENDDRGVLFYNSHEFIQKNKPRYFIFENVKGLLSSKSQLTYQNSIYSLLYEFEKIEQWQNLNTQKNSLSLLSQSIASYLSLNFAKKLNLKRDKYGTYSTLNSELNFEKMERLVKSGLKRRSKFLEERIYQITKNTNYYQKELTVPLGCKEEDLDLSQNQLYLIENLSLKVISTLEKTVGINCNTSLFANSILEENSKKGKWYTTLTELNSTIESKTFMYVLELNIIRLIILALDLSRNLWKEIWLTLTGKKGFIGLKTFDIWLFNLDHLNYHVYHKVLNAKKYGVPQNRERVFIVGIRDDYDNTFNWPKESQLKKRLKDVLETNVSEKYYLSEKMTKGFIVKKHVSNNDLLNNENYIKEGFVNQDTQASTVISTTGVSGNLCAGTHGYANGYISVKSATKSGYEIVNQGDSINLSNPNSETRRGRVGKEVAQTLDTSCNQAVMVSKEVRTEESKLKRKKTGTNDFRGKEIEFREQEFSNTITTSLTKDHMIKKGFSIRRLTPKECFRLMGFPDSFIYKTNDEISDTQLYKQAGNSIVVDVLALIISKLKF